MDLLNIIFGGGHFEIQYGRRAKCISLYSSSLPVRKVYDFNPNIHGWKRPRGRPILLASTTSMLPRWSLTDPSGRPLFADCQRSDPSRALKGALYRIWCGVNKLGESGVKVV